MRISFTLLLLLAVGTQAIQWQPSGNVMWGYNCDWVGGDLRHVSSSGSQCGGICEADQACSHFTWTNYNHGTCWLKGNGVAPTAVDKNTESAVCGWVNRDSGGGGGGGSGSTVTAKGTRWADTTDPGGCQLPNTATYAVNHALALGQAEALGYLKWKPGLCGQVLNVQCGGSSVQAVVASTCNLGSGTCGVDLITRTWNAATGNKPPGEASCQVSLSTTNPISGSGPLCFYRPNSELNNAYFKALGVLNTSGKLVESAVLAGVTGQKGQDGWFLFYGSGQFGTGATVTFRFEGGSQASFTLSQCQPGGQTRIFS